ncbi:MAG: polyprenyl synthetase family protein [bacterium]
MLSRIMSPVARELGMMESVLSAESAFGVPGADSVAMHVSEKAGKKIRPAVFLLAARALSNDGFEARAAEMAKIAAAIELVHTASLLHDDVLDESMTRRGRPSANALFGNRASILAGDLLWCRASEIIIKTENPRLLTEFVRAARRTTLGEMMEESSHNDRDAYLAMVEAKTGSLFSVAAHSAAIVTSSGEGLEEALSDYGSSLGIAFQIADDVIDSGDDKNPLTAKAVFMLGGKTDALKLALEFSERAKGRLAGLPPSGEIESLRLLADYAVSRAKQLHSF